MTQRNLNAPVVGTDPICEAIAKSLSGISGVPPMEQERMIRRAAKAGASALRSQSRKSVQIILSAFSPAGMFCGEDCILPDSRFLNALEYLRTRYITESVK